MMRSWDEQGWRTFEPGDIAPEDRGFLIGDGVFETMRVAGGRIRHSDAHRDRFEAACAALDLDCPAEWGQVEAAATGLPDGSILRLTLTRGPGPRGIGPVTEPEPRLFLADFPPVSPPEPVSLCTVSIRRSPSSLASRYKTLSYADNAAARREAVASGADMALLLTTEGHVSGADCANLFWIKGDVLCTPLPGCAIRPGVMREAVMAKARDTGLMVREHVFPPAALLSAGAVFVTNAAMGVVPVRRIDGRTVPASHPAMLRLSEAVSTAG
ncbi:aminotransferase class IV [Hyphobacterium sp. SN044]|uniref:aminotransferase class IV n=1 Tax=Hyphobacterium sp. SN044 TaxID=2912575 RepID=UPI001F441C8D|nr:aminotransferase class IV [Hyphobacterium sp. SN044]MCF8879597.1 aminotransferase class IV [Hyphobacterium sp. SN044]